MQVGRGQLLPNKKKTLTSAEVMISVKISAKMLRKKIAVCEENNENKNVATKKTKTLTVANEQTCRVESMRS